MLVLLDSMTSLLVTIVTTSHKDAVLVVGAELLTRKSVNKWGDVKPIPQHLVIASNSSSELLPWRRTHGTYTDSQAAGDVN
jgi:hypothetical protein